MRRGNLSRCCIVQASVTRISLVHAMERAGQAEACMREEAKAGTRTDAVDGSLGGTRSLSPSRARSIFP